MNSAKILFKRPHRERCCYTLFQNLKLKIIMYIVQDIQTKASISHSCNKYTYGASMYSNLNC